MHYLMAALLLIVSGSVSIAGDASTLGEPQLEPGKLRMQPTALPKPNGPVLTPETYPRTSGSTSAEPLGVWVACRLLNRECEWVGRYWSESHLCPLKANAGKDKPLNERLDHEIFAKMQHFGTHGSYKNLIAGTVDLIYECRTPSEDERKLAESNEVGLDIRPVARDAFVFIRHRDNPVTGLTLEQARDIYTPEAAGKGKISNWKQVGGLDTEIHPYVRNRNSGSQETMQRLVMKERSMIDGQSMMNLMAMTGPFNLLFDDDAGVGFTFFYYERHMAPLPQQTAQQTTDGETPAPVVEMFAMDGVMPSLKSIADRTYPLITDVYVVTRKDLKADHPAAKLRDWLFTPEGQGIVGETGYVPILSGGN